MEINEVKSTLTLMAQQLAKSTERPGTYYGTHFYDLGDKLMWANGKDGDPCGTDSWFIVDKNVKDTYTKVDKCTSSMDKYRIDLVEGNTLVGFKAADYTVCEVGGNQNANCHEQLCQEHLRDGIHRVDEQDFITIVTAQYGQWPVEPPVVKDRIGLQNLLTGADCHLHYVIMNNSDTDLVVVPYPHSGLFNTLSIGYVLGILRLHFSRVEFYRSRNGGLATLALRVLDAGGNAFYWGNVTELHPLAGSPSE